jgi:transcriptional regulator with XRE-family HTH domain
MKSAQVGARLGPMDHTEDRAGRGAKIQARREALGMSVRALAEWMADNGERVGIAGPVTRQTITKAEADDPTTTPQTYMRIEAWLAALEYEMSSEREALTPIGPAESNLVTFRLSGNFGVDVVVEGPVTNLPELEAAVEKLLRGMREGTPDTNAG